MSTDLTAATMTATVDYSAANEYIRAHYNQSRYFESGDRDISETQIHDGRTSQSLYLNEKKMLNVNGLAIFNSTITQEPNWSDVEDIQNLYLPELEAIILKVFTPSKLLGCCFWNPMMRGETFDVSRDGRGEGGVQTPTANVASLVHIDTDVGAYESINDVLDIVEKNKVQSQSTNSANTNQFNVKEMADAIIHGKKRFVIINFWRNIADTPVTSAPLAILSTRYDEQQSAFPNVQPNMNESKWYMFPNATKDEVIVFYQYDRNVLQPSDLWHCAISSNRGGESDTNECMHQPRKSFDIRAFIVLDETVPDEFDRFSPDRTRPILNFEESGCFCDEQAAKRGADESWK